MRIIGRSNSTMLMILITIIMTFIGFHLYQKDKHLQQPNQFIEPEHDQKKLPLVIKTLKNEQLPNEGMK